MMWATVLWDVLKSYVTDAWRALRRWYRDNRA